MEGKVRGRKMEGVMPRGGGKGRKRERGEGEGRRRRWRGRGRGRVEGGVEGINLSVTCMFSQSSCFSSDRSRLLS